jgi:hypothetical protein
LSKKVTSTTLRLSSREKGWLAFLVPSFRDFSEAVFSQALLVFFFRAIPKVDRGSPEQDM